MKGVISMFIQTLLIMEMAVCLHRIKGLDSNSWEVVTGTEGGKSMFGVNNSTFEFPVELSPVSVGSGYFRIEGVSRVKKETNPDSSFIGPTSDYREETPKEIYAAQFPYRIRGKRSTYRDSGNKLWKGIKRGVPHSYVRTPYSIFRRNSVKEHKPRLMRDDYIGKRSLFMPQDVPKGKMFRNGYTPGQMSRSVRIFKKMRKKIMNEDRLGYEIWESMNANTANEVLQDSKHQYRCKVSTNGNLNIREGRMVGSKGITYSEDHGNGLKSLLCKAETSEIYKPDETTIIKNSVKGLNVVTTDRDPFKFLDIGNEINNDVLEIGSKAVSALDSKSTKNQSISSVSTQDRDATSQSKVSTKFVNDKGVKSFESKSDVEGSTIFNVTHGQKPIVLTSKHQESSSVVQSPKVFRDKDIGVSTFYSYRKKTDFDIAFRHLFDS